MSELPRLTASDAPDVPVVIFYRLFVDERRRRVLDEAHIQTVFTNSTAQCVELIAQAKKAIVLVDVSGGGNGPERIVKAMQDGNRSHALPAHSLPASTARHRFDLIACTSQPGTGTARAARLGVEKLYVWPDGGFSTLLARLPSSGSVNIRRVAERATLREVTHVVDLERGVQARLVNISTTGALVAMAEDPTALEHLVFELVFDGRAATVVGRIVWRERSEEEWKVGIHFGSLSQSMKTSIARFIRLQNVVRIEPKKAEPSAGSAQRLRARVTLGRRSDWFRLEQAENNTMILAPKQSFFVPYRAGDVVSIEARGAVIETFEAKIVESFPLEPGRIDSRICWRVLPVQPMASLQAMAQAISPPTTKNLPLEGSLLGDSVRNELATNGGPETLENGIEETERISSELLIDSSSEEDTGIHRRRRKDQLSEKAKNTVGAWSLTPERVVDGCFYLLGPSVTGFFHNTTSSYFRMNVQWNDESHIVLLHPSHCVYALPAADLSRGMRVGRSHGNDICIPEPTISGHHAAFRSTLDHPLLVSDTGSTNGTLRIRARGAGLECVARGEESILDPGDTLLLGEYRLTAFDAPRFRLLLSMLAPLLATVRTEQEQAASR